MDRRFYVYVVFRLNGAPCYVGKGQGKRAYRDFRKSGSNEHLQRIALQTDGQLPVVKVREHMTSEEACELEMELIRILGRGHGQLLVNQTAGGEGVLSPTPESSEKKRQAMRQYCATPKGRTHLSNRKGVTLTDETKAKIGAALQGREYSAETLAKMRKAFAERKHDPLWRERMRRASAARWGREVNTEPLAPLDEAELLRLERRRERRAKRRELRKAA